MSSESSPIRLLSVDDHPLIRQRIAGLVAVQADMKLIAEAGYKDRTPAAMAGFKRGIIEG